MEVSENQEGISKKLLALNVVLVLLVVFMVFNIYSAFHPKVMQQAQVVDATVTTAFNNLNLAAKSVYVFDISENKVIFKKNEFVQLPLASIVKLMTALVATELLPANSQVMIRKEFLSPEGDSGLFVNESWKLKDLIDFSLVASSNDGAMSLASVAGAFGLGSHDYEFGREYFIEKMNAKAVELGMKETYFVNESGLDEGGISGGYGSAIDVAKLMKYILETKPELLEATKYPNIIIKSLSQSHIIKNTNTDINQITGLIASKTGFTDMAGGNLAIAFDASIGRPIIVVVLGSTEFGRFDDVSALVKASLEYVRD